MRFKEFSLRCECGRTPLIRKAGLTEQHQLVLECWCAGCKRFTFFVKDLSDCWRECPKPDAESEAAELPAELAAALDARFLRELGVRMPD